ncbi:ferric reductase-like transmembrane domain-containing protein [Candidatus Gottesmanbacteria bacterium]|nr:ferric reductase-like transmembrane domain-containing protein [Candidatus Gottesmanbacteria bacterium]
MTNRYIFQVLQDKIFQTAAKEKSTIDRFFTISYIVILGVLIWGSIVTLRQTSEASLVYRVGIWSGEMAVALLAIVLVPGILGRFGIQIKVTRVITFYRRQLGILTFLFSFTHGMLVRIVARIGLGWYPVGRAPLFEVFGTLALSLLFFLFVTSNDVSVHHLGVWWKRLHRLVYVIVWVILFHTLLQRISVWSVLIGVVAVLEVASLIYAKYLASQGPSTSSG